MEKIKKVNSNIPVLEKRCRCCKKGKNLNGTEEDFHYAFISRNWFRLNFRLHFLGQVLGFELHFTLFLSIV